MLRKIGRNEIKMQEANDRSYEIQSHPPIIPSIKIELDINTHPPIQWATPKISNNNMQQQPHQLTCQKEDTLKTIQHAIVDILVAMTSLTFFSAFGRRFKKFTNKTTVIIAVLLQIRQFEKSKRQEFYSRYIQEVGKIYENEAHLLSQLQINCLKQSIGFVQEFIQRDPSKAICSFFPKYRKNKIFSPQKVQKLIHVLYRRLTADPDIQSEHVSSQENEQQFFKHQIKRQQVNRILNGNPFLIYRREDQSQTQLYPTDASFIPKGIKNLLPS